MTTQESNDFNCSKCNAELTVPPGASSLVCPYCENEENFERKGTVDELDYHLFLQLASEKAEDEEVSFRSCDGCGAQITIDDSTHSDQCPYCGKTYVTSTNETGHGIKPRSLLPFKVTRQTANEEYQTWVKKRWFAPGSFKKAAQKNESLEGIYLPHWTFDSKTESEYTGKRGEYYYVTERYTTTEDGKSVTKTRQVRKTRWYHASGTVYRSFDDIITPAGTSLPKKYVERLEPWDLHALVPFDEAYLQGYRSERYTIDLESGFEHAKVEMDDDITSAVRADIGGDTQRINGIWTSYRDITFKHILLPVWVTAYRHKDKVYRIVINARTGEVQGERPWSWVKILSLVLFLVILLGTIAYFGEFSY